MSELWRIRCRLVALAAVVLVSLVASPWPQEVWATQTHVTSGSGGTHSSSSHGLNRPHFKILVRASNQGAVTSGGRFHDGCGDGTCNPVWVGNDWALDEDSEDWWQTGLSIDLDNYGASSLVGAGQTPPIFRIPIGP
jgi:hypothetical protein